VDRPGDIEEVLSEVRLAGLESVTIRNLTSGRDGRAVRVFADGSYDGFVPVEPGPNQLEVRARMSDASTASGTVDIFVERAEVQSEQERADDQRLLDELRARTAETELLEEQERARKQRGETSVEIEVEKDEEKPESEPKPETDPAPRP
jgi:hypothetical protein